MSHFSLVWRPLDLNCAGRGKATALEPCAQRDKGDKVVVGIDAAAAETLLLEAITGGGFENDASADRAGSWGREPCSEQ
jgi:hypothetical protein